MIPSMIAFSMPASAARPIRCPSGPATFARAWLVLACLVFAVGAACAGESPAPDTVPGAGQAGAPAVAAKPGAPRSARSASTLRVFNRPIIGFRVPLFGIPPAERVSVAHARTTALLERGGEGRVTVDKESLGNVVKVDGGLAFIVAEGDADPLSGETDRKSVV